MKILFIFISILLPPAVASSQSTTWKLDNLTKVGGHRIEVFGQPKVIKTEDGKAIEFDGVDDGIFIETNPLTGAKTFTIESWFRPDADGPAEQRWLHVEDLENVESRAMLETRVSKDLWFLDTFLKIRREPPSALRREFQTPDRPVVSRCARLRRCRNAALHRR